MGVINTIKKVDRDRIGCRGRARVTLGLTAAPDLLLHPADIVLALDVSGSMCGEPLLQMKESASELIDLLAQAAGGSAEEGNESGSRFGLVSFAAHAKTETALTADAAALQQAISSLQAGGCTGHAEAFLRASSLFDMHSSRRKIIVMFTNGMTTVGPDASPYARRARENGIEIYCIGLNAPLSFLNQWASEPTEDHVAATHYLRNLNEMFQRIGRELVGTGAREISIAEQVNADFRITEIEQPVFGHAEQTGKTSLRWNVDALGETEEETAQLVFEIEHIGEYGGRKRVNRRISYQDREGRSVQFPSPTILVDCGTEPEPCPEASCFQMESCRDQTEVDLPPITPQAGGRLIQLNAAVRDVCPGKRVALAVQLYERLEEGCCRPCGLQVFTIPAHEQAGCRDVQVNCIRFAVPEAEGQSICGERTFCVQLTANYLDTDAVICETSSVVLG